MHVRFFFGFAISSLALVLILTFARDASAEPPAPKADTRGCVQAESFLNARLGIWQQRMNLADWKVTILMSRASDLKPKTLGNIHWETNQKTAVIKVLDASDYRLACSDMLADMEMTVVHELVHLELSSLPRSQASRHEEEMAVNRIADALLRLDRKESANATDATLLPATR
jgi:hypothetical protein